MDLGTRADQNVVRAVVDDLLHVSRHRPATDVPDAVAKAAGRFGGREIEIYLADYDQRLLRPIRGDGESITIDATVAGRAFTTNEIVDMPRDDGVRVWVPLVDGAERLGVAHIVFDDYTDELREWLPAFSGLVAEVIVSLSQYTDGFFRARRGHEMTLAAEIQWSQLPPLTYSADALTITALLEPAYSIAGDAFDYAHNDPILHLAVFDAMGHGLNSTLTATMALGAYRHARRIGLDLQSTYAAIDTEIAVHRPDGFSTAICAELDCHSGRFVWFSAGHPAPMLIRDRALQRLAVLPSLPLGLGAGFGVSQPVVAETNLQPGDRVIVFSDGCTEATTPGGERFGEERLGQFVMREQASGLGPAETLRRLAHAVMDHAGGKIDDDATILLLEFTGKQLESEPSETGPAADQTR